MYDWKTQFIRLLLDERTTCAHSLLLEYVTEEEEVIEAIHQLSCLAIDFIDDPILVAQLDNIVRKLEASLV